MTKGHQLEGIGVFFHSADPFHTGSVGTVLGCGRFALQAAGVDPILDTLNAVSELIDRLESKQSLGLRHIKGDFASLSHTPGKAHVHFNAWHDALNDLYEFGASCPALKW